MKYRDLEGVSVQLGRPDEIVNRLRNLHAEGGPPHFEEAINLFLELDTWLLNGGRPPEDWMAAFGPTEVRGQLIRR